MGAEDTITPEYYPIWPNLGKKLSEQLGEIRNDTAAMAPLVRGMGLDAAGDFSNLDGIAAAAVQSRELGQQDFHNRFRTYYNKTDNLFEIAYNKGTTLIPEWYTTWWINSDGQVTQQNTPTTASNVGGGQGWFKQKVGVDLEFKSVTATLPITIVDDGNSLDVDGSALISNYSTLGGDEALTTAKSANNLPFKGLSAGPNVVLTASGTDIQIESTAQVVEFYGIVVQHTDGSAIFPGVHILKVDPNAFYLVGPASGRSAEAILGFRGETLESNSFVAVIGDEMTGALSMFDGTESLPAVTWTGDEDTGIRHRAADDMAFVSGGADIARVLTDRLLVSKRLQVTAAGNAGTPDIFWNADSTTGLFQNTPSDDSIAFATAGVRAGYFDSAQDFFVTNEIKAGDGAVGSPAYSFAAEPDTGVYRKTTDQLAFATGGVAAGWFNANQDLVLVNDLFIADGSFGAPSYSFVSDQNTGIYQRGDDELGFATAGTERGYFGSTGVFFVTNTVTSSNASAAAPTYNFTTASTTGLFRKAANSMGFSSGGVEAGYIDSAQKWFFTNDVQAAGVVIAGDGSAGAPGFTFNTDNTDGFFLPNTNTIHIALNGVSHVQWVTSGVFTPVASYFNYTANAAAWGGTHGTAALPAYSFFPDTNTGLYQNASDDDSLAFTTGGVRAGYFDADQTLHVQNDLRASRVEAGPAVFYVQDEATNAIQASPGSLGAPSYSFTTDSDSGLISPFPGAIDIVLNGFARMRYGTGQITFVEPIRSNVGDASATQPDFSFSGDNNTGIYSPNDDSLAFTTGGVEAGFFDANQNLHVQNDLRSSRVEAGIGRFYTSLTLDTGFLNLRRDSTLTNLALRFSDDTNTGIFSSTADRLSFAINGSEFLRLGIDGGQKNLLLVSPGTATVPALQFNDANTGFFRAVTDTLSISVGGSELTRWNQRDSDDDFIIFKDTVGINLGVSTVPTHTLQVGGSGLFDNDLNVINDINSGRVEAGIGTFYTLLLVGQTHSSLTDIHIRTTNDTDTGIGFREELIDFIVTGSRRTTFATSGVLSVGFLSLGNGSAAVPLIRNNVDTNTGAYWPTTDQFGFSTGGIQAGYFDDGQSLHVTNNVFADSFYMGIRQQYTETNVTTDRTFDASTVAISELADVVGTLIKDLKQVGVIK